MKSLHDMDDYLTDQRGMAEETFGKELATDENKDYRRGFRAGVLFAYLSTQAHLRGEPNAASE